MDALIFRSELVDVVQRAATGITLSTQEKLAAVAADTEAVAVGWFHHHGVACPINQVMRRFGAPRRNQAFTEAFDRAMAERFGRSVNEGARHPVEPFVVHVVPDPADGAYPNTNEGDR